MTQTRGDVTAIDKSECRRWRSPDDWASPPSSTSSMRFPMSDERDDRALRRLDTLDEDDTPDLREPDLREPRERALLEREARERDAPDETDALDDTV